MINIFDTSRSLALRIYRQYGAVMPLYEVERIEGPIGVNWESALVDLVDYLSEEHLPQDNCIRIASKTRLQFLENARFPHSVSVDPLFWSGDCANMYGYLLYLE